MKIKSGGWRTCGLTLGRRSYGEVPHGKRSRARMKGESTKGATSYMDHVADAASFEAFQRKDVDPLLSAEALPENSSFINFSAFAQEYPEKFFEFVSHLRPEFQELCIEYYVLHKPQHFIGDAHGFIQTRTWQALRIIEQAIGAMILLGPEPTEEIIRPILRRAGVETTEHGSLTHMVIAYQKTQSYAAVAKYFNVPAPTIRKIFRPIIRTLLAAKDVNAVAVGAYLRSLTHQASLTRRGLSKSCKARLRRVRQLKFDAPPLDNSPLMSFGRVESLGDTPWCMLEISSDHRMLQLGPALKKYGKKLFGKKPAQIFAPVNSDGELQFGYLFARCATQSLVRALTRVRGITELASICDEEGSFMRAVTVPNEEVQQMIEDHTGPVEVRSKIGNFVKILTGPAAEYCGTITAATKNEVTVRVDFPTGRQFIVTADRTSIEPFDESMKNRAFWGVRPR